MGELESILKKLIGFNTVNNPGLNLQPTIECAEYISTYLSDKCNIENKIITSKEFFSIFGQVGQGSPHILLLAHMDTVPVRPEQWLTNPFELTIKGDKAYGRGALDNKSGVTILMNVAENSSKLATEQGKLSFAITGDEEIGGQNGAKIIYEKLVQEAQLPDFIINCDANGESITTRRRNGFGVTLQVPRTGSIVQGKKVCIRFDTKIEGREMRHSAYFLPGIDQHALLKASKFLRDHRGWKIHAIREQSFIKSNVVPDYITLDVIEPYQEGQSWNTEDSLTDLFKSFLAFSRISFKTDFSDFGINSLPNLLNLSKEEIEVYFDVRAMTKDLNEVKSAFESVVIEKFDKFTLNLGGGQGVLNTSKDSILVQQAQKVAKDYHISPILTELEGASDSRFFSQSNIPIIDIGPCGANLHGANEYVVISSLKRVALFINALVEKLIISRVKFS